MKFDRKSDRLISLGDLMDRGRQSYEVFDFFRRLKAETGDRCVIIRGNHVDMMINAALWQGDSPLWKNNGGNKTIRSFHNHGTHAFHHAEWFKQHTILTYEEESRFTKTAEEYGAEKVIYSHCHGHKRYGDSIRGYQNGMEYKLVSSDYLWFNPERILS